MITLYFTPVVIALVVRVVVLPVEVSVRTMSKESPMLTVFVMLMGSVFEMELSSWSEIVSEKVM